MHTKNAPQVFPSTHTEKYLRLIQLSLVHLNSKITAEPPFQHQGRYRNKALQTVCVWVRCLLTVKLFAKKICMLPGQTWFI